MACILSKIKRKDKRSSALHDGIPPRGRREKPSFFIPSRRRRARFAADARRLAGVETEDDSGRYPAFDLF